MKTILVTGASGYIGSHTITALYEAGYDVVAIDNLCNSSETVTDRLRKIVGFNFPFYEIDVRDSSSVRSVITKHKIDAAIHFAGLKSVSESVLQPLKYYDNNVAGTIAFLQVLYSYGVKRLVFSSSATVYGDFKDVLISETAPLQSAHSYGMSKIVVEKILGDISNTGEKWNIGILRYFNPIGAHKSGLIGDNPKGIPSNLIPCVARVASGQHGKLLIFGNDWSTPDGTAIRDYIHVMDVARGHILALNYLFSNDSGFTVNLGTGRGYSVLEVVKTFERVNNCYVPYEFTSRRNGDVAICCADATLAKKLFGWESSIDLDTMCRDVWRWQTNVINMEG